MFYDEELYMYVCMNSASKKIRFKYVTIESKAVTLEVISRDLHVIFTWSSYRMLISIPHIRIYKFGVKNIFKNKGKILKNL